MCLDIPLRRTIKTAILHVIRRHRTPTRGKEDCKKEEEMADDEQHQHQHQQAQQQQHHQRQQQQQQRYLEAEQTFHLIQSALTTAPDDWRTQLPPARAVIRACDRGDYHHYWHTLYVSSGNSADAVVARQVAVVNTFQKLAYGDADAGPVGDVADWCLRQWLGILQGSPGRVEALTGVGQWWLSRAQPCLYRIHEVDGSSSSSSSGASWRATLRPPTATATMTPAEEARQSDEAGAEADARLHTADYVEARGILLPATEYLDRAVESAMAQGRCEGGLLILAAEAYMSLGNVSYARSNERYFRQALSYLRTAQAIAGFSLPPHLQAYLAAYGDF
ncbi:hypothetical protein K402DRAFT_92523 [Aulographum hederae CBS 113979]|uniref:Uncharacterized protein n=1 Tax=Aulographum hederae CBS 113979 TaxID=1176131 RepID=A0A6G1GZL3_9PEZI|nr:hypothetical protein K402DRAFT_92523 [Aulographum hederae CBS 113979]